MRTCNHAFFIFNMLTKKCFYIQTQKAITVFWLAQIFSKSYKSCFQKTKGAFGRLRAHISWCQPPFIIFHPSMIPEELPLPPAKHNMTINCLAQFNKVLNHWVIGHQFGPLLSLREGPRFKPGFNTPHL